MAKNKKPKKVPLKFKQPSQKKFDLHFDNVTLHIDAAVPGGAAFFAGDGCPRPFSTKPYDVAFNTVATTLLALVVAGIPIYKPGLQKALNTISDHIGNEYGDDTATCDHPWHQNPALITPCPACGAGKDEE